MSRCRDRKGTASPIRIRQPENGYRFSIDSVLLADFAAAYCGRSVLDLGTGSGVLLLLLAGRSGRLRKGVGVEIQPQLHAFAVRNIEENGFGDRLCAILGDFRDDVPGLAHRSFDLVVSNPPYRKVGEGRRNPDPRKEIARHEVACTMADVYAAAERHLSPRGRFAIVSSSHRLPEIFSLGFAAGILPETIRFVHPHADAPANRLLVAGSRRKAKEPVVLPPLVVYSARGTYHPEVERIFARFFRG